MHVRGSGVLAGRLCAGLVLVLLAVAARPFAVKMQELVSNR